MGQVASIGIDAGSTAVKIVGIDKNSRILFHITEPTEPKIEEQVKRLLRKIETELGVDISGIPITATGYGSSLILEARKRVTEITCHAKGVFTYFGHGGTLVDIGGQDSKVIVVGNRGQVIDFVMNDKCAAGTGRFLETTAWRLKIPVEEMGKLALSSSQEVPISSTCAVFAESEVISMLARGKALEAVIRGLHRALVKRVVAMIDNVGLVSPLILSGGVVCNEAVQKMIEEETGVKPLVPEHPQLMGAYGAAIIGLSEEV